VERRIIGQNNEKICQAITRACMEIFLLKIGYLKWLSEILGN
jgi:hypothetical protein